VTNNPKSDFELRFEKQNNYLIASVTGEKDTLEISKRFWKLVGY
jgi:hypothetical protein